MMTVVTSLWRAKK